MPVKLSLNPLRGLLVVVAVGASLVGLTVFVGAAALLARPGSPVAHPALAASALFAYAGTALPALLPALALVGAFALAWRESASGGAVGWESLGVGPSRGFARWWPLWLAVVAGAPVAGLVVEPAAWGALDGLKAHGPAVAWWRLVEGETRVLPGGGALTARQGRLSLHAGVGGWTAAAERCAPGGRLEWRCQGLEARGPDGQRWRAAVASLRGTPRPRRRPLVALDAAALRRRTAAEPWVAERAARVAQARVALAPLALALAWVGWALGWSPRPRAGLRGELLALGLVLAAVYLAATLGQRGVRDGHLPGAVAAWTPVALAALAAVAVAARRRP